MSVTATQYPGDGVARVATGAYLTSSTAAAIEINCGFTPKYVKVVNVTAASTGLVTMEWFEGMTAGYGIKTNDEGTSETGVTLITTLGITPSSTTGLGFTIGLDTDLNVINEQLYWIAIG